MTAIMPQTSLRHRDKGTPGFYRKVNLRSTRPLLTWVVTRAEANHGAKSGGQIEMVNRPGGAENTWYLTLPRSGYFDGLAGCSLRVKTHTVAPRRAPPPIPMARGESRRPPVAAAGACPSAPFFFFFFLLSLWDWESSRVVS